jgi:tetrahydromethanopterin S-methyltransferase subunit G
MSMVEDVRQVLQEFIAPKLRAISARLDAIEKVMEARFEEVDSRFNEVSVKIQALQETVDRNDESQKQTITSLTQGFQLDERLADIEQELRRTRASVA